VGVEQERDWAQGVKTAQMPLIAALPGLFLVHPFFFGEWVFLFLGCREIANTLNRKRRFGC
jgi:hypothetical protein